MHTQFGTWFEMNMNLFKNKGIETELIRRSETDNPANTYVQASRHCLGQISIWESGCMDMEILRIDNGDTLLYEHHDFSETPDFTTIVKNYLRIMGAGE